ncbi:MULTISPECIES: DUF742 domain-containing protein [unclassified Nocardiopsis]|uniref:DUF742 domain-containing protein n=1 Tax=unclassified Nocardiopsis TaxID=2649073 RepID=UPI0013576B06|nr:MULTISPECIES: DUF742 domain-containing protein [unclassified Nocardiopsis]
MRAESTRGFEPAEAEGRTADPCPPAPEPPEGEEDQAQERFLRPFAVTAGDPEAPVLTPGPTAPGLLDLVVAARAPGHREWLRPEREALLDHARQARTVVELAARVRLPVGQVRAIAAAMIADGSLQRCGPSRPLGREDLLHAVLVGLRSL